MISAYHEKEQNWCKENAGWRKNSVKIKKLFNLKTAVGRAVFRSKSLLSDVLCKGHVAMCPCNSQETHPGFF